MQLNLDDEPRFVGDMLVVDRTIQLNLCRCRECKDTCRNLSNSPHVICARCNNNHTQYEGPNYVGPYVGSRRVLENLAAIELD